MSITLNVNGQNYTVDVSPETPLLWVVRDQLGMTGTKFGCGIAQCGACTVHVDEQPVRACSMPISAVEGKKITTIEGAQSKTAQAVQQAWQTIQVPQCGYCQSGQIMSAIALLEKNTAPSDSDIDGAMQGNICRCATYTRIRAAIKTAANTLES